MSTQLKLGEHIYYVDGSSYMCKYCCAGFSVYDITKEGLDYMKKLDCKDNKCIKDKEFDQHDFIFNEKSMSYNCKYCSQRMFNSPWDPEIYLSDCISAEEKIIKDIIE